MNWLKSMCGGMYMLTIIIALIFPYDHLIFPSNTSHVHSYAVEMSGGMLYDLVHIKQIILIMPSLYLPLQAPLLFLPHTHSHSRHIYIDTIYCSVFSAREHVNNIRQLAISKYYTEFIYVLFLFRCNSFSNNFSKERTQVNSFM